MVRSPFLAPVWEVSGQLFGLTVWTVDISINCLVAHTNFLAFKEQSTRDLFGRPTFFELFDHSLSQADKAHQFLTACTPLNRSALSNNTIVSVQFRQVFVGIAWILKGRCDGYRYLNRPGFTGGQNFRRIAHYGTVTQQEDLEAVFT